ncbi:tetratricopeptide repeat protein [Streptomyces sp. NPDC004227]
MRPLPAETGFGSDSDIVSAGERTLRSALRGDPAARAELVRLRASLIELADSGSAKARSLLGGIALEYDRKPADAFHHFTLAAEQGDPAGQRGLGHLYSKGLGVERDPAAAERLFRLAAEGGDAYAKHNLAVIHLAHEPPPGLSPNHHVRARPGN